MYRMPIKKYSKLLHNPERNLLKGLIHLFLFCIYILKHISCAHNTIASSELGLLFHLRAQMCSELPHRAPVTGYRNCLKAAPSLFSVNTNSTAKIKHCPCTSLVFYHQFNIKSCLRYCIKTD